MFVSNLLNYSSEIGWHSFKSTATLLASDYRVRLVGLAAIAAVSYVKREKIYNNIKAYVIDPLWWYWSGKQEALKELMSGQNVEEFLPKYSPPQVFDILSTYMDRAKSEDKKEKIEWSSLTLEQRFKKLCEGVLSDEKLVKGADRIIPTAEYDATLIRTRQDIIAQQLALLAAWFSQIIHGFDLEDFKLTNFVKWISESPTNVLTILFNVSLPILYNEYKETIFEWVKYYLGDFVAQNQGKLLGAAAAFCFCLYVFKRTENRRGVWDLNYLVETGKIPCTGIDFIPSQKEAYKKADLCLSENLANAEHIVLYTLDHAPGSPIHAFTKGLVERSVTGRSPHKHEFVEFDLFTFLSDRKEQSPVSRWREEVGRAKASGKTVILGNLEMLFQGGRPNREEGGFLDERTELLGAIYDTLVARDIRCILTVQEPFKEELLKRSGAAKKLFDFVLVPRMTQEETVTFLEQQYMPTNRWNIPTLSHEATEQLVEKIVESKGEHQLPELPNEVVDVVRKVLLVQRHRPEAIRLLRENIDLLDKRLKSVRLALEDDLGDRERLLVQEQDLLTSVTEKKEELKALKQKFKEETEKWEEIGQNEGRLLDEVRHIEERLIKQYWKHRRVLSENDPKLLKIVKQLHLVRYVITPYFKTKVDQQLKGLELFPWEMKKEALLHETEKLEQRKISSAREEEKVRIEDMRENLKQYAPGREFEVDALCDVFKTKRITHDNENNQPAVFVLAGDRGGGKSHLADLFGWEVEKALGLHPDGNQLNPEGIKGFGMTEKSWENSEMSIFIDDILNLAEEHPHVLIRLDEWDKVPQKVQDMFLSLFDNTIKHRNTLPMKWARIEGEESKENEPIKLNNVIFVITVNLGAGKLLNVNTAKDPADAFKHNQNIVRDLIKEKLGENAKPFLDRVSEVIPFGPVDENNMKDYVRSFLRKAKQKFKKDHDCILTLDQSIVEYFYNKAKSNNQEAVGKDISDDPSISLRILKKIIPQELSELLAPRLKGKTKFKILAQKKSTEEGEELVAEPLKAPK